MRGLFFASFGAMSWGISGVCSQYLFMNYELDSAWLTAIRMLLSGIVLLIISAI
ncbi:EamA family transporter, partial [Peptoniphilus harei]